MLAPNTVLRLHHGTTVRIEEVLGAGGEGIVYRATDERSGQPAAFKLFKSGTPERAARTKAIVARQLGELSELFCAPTDYYENHSLGHISPLAPGIPLDQHLEATDNAYPDTLKLAIALAHGHAILEAQGIAHGDPGLSQASVHPAPSGPELHMFDFDNCSIPGLPPPPCYGQEDRMAPELKRALNGGPPCLPDVFTDRYAIATVMHSLLLAKDVAFGFDGSPEMFERAMSGGWPHDPALGLARGIPGGFPGTILNAELAGLLRRGLSAAGEERSTAAEWADGLSRNLLQLWIDPRCQGPSFIDPSRTRCPICGRAFPALKLVFPALGKEIPCATAAALIGRADLGSPRVSRQHAIVRRRGPETRLESLGRNGCFRWDGHRWLRLPHESVLQENDRLRFADVECSVQSDG